MILMTPKEYLEEAAVLMSKDCNSWQAYEARTQRAQTLINLALAVDKVGQE